MSAHQSSAVISSMKRIEKEGEGVMVYIRNSENIPVDKSLENEGLNKDKSLREYGVGAQILQSLGVQSFRLLSNSDRKIVGLDGFGLSCTERLPLD